MRCVPEQKNARGVRMIIAALLIGGGVFYAIPHAAQAEEFNGAHVQSTTGSGSSRMPKRS